MNDGTLYTIDNWRGTGLSLTLNRGGALTVVNRDQHAAWETMAQESGEDGPLALLTARERYIRGYNGAFSPILFPAFVLVAHALPMFPIPSIIMHPMNPDERRYQQDLASVTFDDDGRTVGAWSGGADERLLNIVWRATGELSVWVHLGWWNRLYFSRKALVPFKGSEGEDCLVRLTDDDHAVSVCAIAYPKNDKQGRATREYGVRSLSGALLDLKTPYRGF